MPHFLRSASNGSVEVLEEKFLKSKFFEILRRINLVNSFRKFKILHDLRPCEGARLIDVGICATDRYTCKSQVDPAPIT